MQLSVEVDGVPKQFRIEFQYISRQQKARRLGYFTGLNAVTTCVLVASTGEIYIASAFCSAADRFTRQEGQERSLKRILFQDFERAVPEHPRARFGEMATDLWMEFVRVSAVARAARASQRLPVTARPRPRKWTPEEIEQARAAKLQSERSVLLDRLKRVEALLHDTEAGSAL